MEHEAIKILNANGTMAISTVRPDGWPQTTVVGYANQGFDLVFMIFRSGQKFANIQHDDRISIAVASRTDDINELQAVYAGAHAKEITDEAERKEAWRQLMQRHANLAGFQMPEGSEAVFMRAKCQYISVLDYTQGIGHREQLVIENGVPVDTDSKKDAWGEAAASKSTE